MAETAQSPSTFASILAGLSNILTSATSRGLPPVQSLFLPNRPYPTTDLSDPSYWMRAGSPLGPAAQILEHYFGGPPPDQGPPQLGGPPTGPTPSIPTGPTRQPSTRAAGPGGDFPAISLNQPALPVPPTMDAPPQLGGSAPIDFSGMNKFLDQANPASAHMNAVLGGLAKGASSVSPAAPGAFAQTLAAMGAGGGAGYASSAGDMSKYAMSRASTDLQQKQIAQAHESEQNRIAFENAKLTYDTNVKNKMMLYEHELKKTEMAMPKVQANTNGIIIQQPGADGKVGVQFYPTKSNQEHLEGLKTTAAVLGMPGPFSEALELKTISDMYPNNPVLAQAELRRAAVNRVVSNGAGASVFGSAYEAAAKKATQIIQQMNPTLATKPEVYQQEFNRIVGGQLIAQPWIHQDAWLERAAPHSMIARAMMGTKETPSAAAGAKSLIPNSEGKLNPLEQ